MSNLASWLVLLAEKDRFRYLGENFRGEHATLTLHEVLIGLVSLTVIVVALWLLAQFVQHRERAQRSYSPRRLFLELCQAHALDRASSKALWRLAQQQQMEHPARLFLEPERFEEPNPVIVRQREVYQQIRLKLFHEPGT